MRVARVSLRYDRREDRLALAVADVQGDVALLWLTRRLADRLVSALLQALDAEAEMRRLQRPTAAPPSPGKAAARRLAEHGWAQLAARMARKASDPVSPGKDVPGHLLTRARLARRRHGYRLEMFYDDSGPASLAMRSGEVRQLLEIIRSAYSRAEWQSTIWPTWLQSSRR